MRRISDDDRLQVVTRLRDAAGQGAIGLDELEQRIEATYDAKTVFDLEPITADLPVATTSRPTAKVEHRRPLVMEDDEFRSHFTVYALVIGMLIGIWILNDPTDTIFWPFFPAAGWGIGLGSHYQVAASHQRKRLARARSLGITLAELEIREAEERKAKREQRRAQRGQLSAHAMKHAELATETAIKHAERAWQRAMPPAAGPRGQPNAPWQWPVPPAPSTPSAPDTTPADPVPPGGTTRFVVAMFVDVVGSTGLNEALGDDGWVRVRARLQDVLRECFEREGGWEVNSAGDGILARFEHPNSAACAAVEIQRRLARQRQETGFAPSVRIGIHSGDAVEVGDDLIGGVVNLASRVTGAGEPDQITVTEHVADHLDGSFDTEDRGIHSLKGVSRPRHLLSVRWN